MQKNFVSIDHKRQKLLSESEDQKLPSDSNFVDVSTFVSAEKLSLKDVDSQNHGVSEEKEVESDGKDTSWPDSLPESQLNLLVRIKHLAMERLRSTGQACLEEAVPASALKALGLLMEELVNHYVENGSLHAGTGSHFSKSISQENEEQIGS
ncbi:hypothetical protein KP509_07G048400 [Ceratopteris richardii]|uniref:Uncharacterized protein n=1 Tax=Ceratopteris richardii TaxID=49495 RepID=A0A8T2UEP3_CERRI|nr:hypothetical protein KP509_07G048400 [Ceratopteris richardii]KAH7432970.1 hypothetical protein KP509_07G048400 [Ceratopteris richardii]